MGGGADEVLVRIHTSKGGQLSSRGDVDDIRTADPGHWRLVGHSVLPFNCNPQKHAHTRPLFGARACALKDASSAR